MESTWVVEVDEPDATTVLCNSLADWVDLDWASFFLAQALGLFLDEDFYVIRWMFMTDNLLSSALDRILSVLVESGILEFRDPTVLSTVGT